MRVRGDVVVPLPTLGGPRFDRPILDANTYERQDGRSCEEVRHLQLLPNPISRTSVSSSALLIHGKTVVAATFTAPRLSTARRAGGAVANDYLKCSVQRTALSQEHRIVLDKAESGTDGSLVLAQCLGSVVCPEAKEGTYVDVDVCVLADDSANATAAAINAGYLAMMLGGVPMRDFVACCSVLVLPLAPDSKQPGLADELVFLLDPTLTEWQSAQHQRLPASLVTLAVACASSRPLYACVRGSPLTSHALVEAQALAIQGCLSMRDSIREQLTHAMQ